MNTQSPLVDAKWLADNLGDPNLVVIDASWYLPAHQRDGRAEYAARHIPGALFYDIDAHSSKETPLPHMLPTPEGFAQSAGSMGISETMTIVIYDGMGMFAAPRLWWTFLVFGAKTVHVLDGGLPAWIAAGYETTSEMPSRARVSFKAQFNSGMVADMDLMTSASSAKAQIADARPRGRFDGSDPEPRAGLSSGHIPGAKSLPQSTLVRNGFFAGPAEVASAFEAAGIDPDRPIITSCGSGMTAATLTLGLAVLGKPLGRLYDGSWTEWAGTPGNAIEKSV